MPAAVLPTAPDCMQDAHGHIRFGRYQGCIARLDWPRPEGRWQRMLQRLRHKRWQYLALTHPDYVIALAVVDVGWTGAAFAYLFDRRTGRLLADVTTDSFPRHGAEVADQPFADAAFSSRALAIRFSACGSYLAVDLQSPALKLAAHVDIGTMPPVLAAIAPLGAHNHSTHKSGALAVSGFADCHGQRYSLDGAVASLDYSNGLLPRETAWRWASAHRAGLGFNLQQGYMAQHENAIWLEQQLFALEGVQFHFEPQQPLRPWHISDDDGLLDLQFTPEGLCRKNQNLLIAASRYIQVIGRFDGHLVHPVSGARHVVQGLSGVTEDHYARW